MVEAVAGTRRLGQLAGVALTVVILSTGLYGAVFGCWRSPQQAAYSAVKMPVFLLAFVILSGGLNMMLANILGLRVTFRQVACAMLINLAITGAILGSLSPAVLVCVAQAPGPESAGALTTYRLLLLAHTAIIGFGGLMGNLRLYRLLCGLTSSRRLAQRVWLCWFLVCVLVGSELSWVISPFLAKPHIPIPFFNPDALKGNFFEYLFNIVTHFH